MPRFRSASAPLIVIVIVFAAFLFPVAAHGTCYEPLCCTYPPVQGTTHIESVSPQVALPGATVVYIEGYCFGDSKGTGSITHNGETMTDIVFWTDAEIAFRPAYDATSGNLVVTSQSYGSDSTAQEANCPASPPGWTPDYCGNGKVNATFNIAQVDAPAYWLPANSPGCPYAQPCPKVAGTQSAPQWVQGTWNYDDGGETMTLTLNQGSQNSDGTWPITGTEVDNIWGQFSVWGTLDQYGDLGLCLAFGNQSPDGVEWLVLGSGDVTSQGLDDGYNGITCTPGIPPVPTRNFLNGSMDSAEGPYYYFGVPPLFKSGTDVPYGETVAFQDWWTGPGSTLPTYGLWERDLPAFILNAGFSGRFVYEQSGGAATDGCWYPGSNYQEVTSTVTGGGWFVDQSGHWGPDTIGISSQADSFYQGYYGPQGQTCEITGPQRLYIDARTGPVPYIVDTQTPAEITPKDLLNGVAPGEGGQAVTACEPYPGIKGKCR